MAVTARRWDLLLVITAAPHYNDMLTSALRLGQAVLDAGGSVRFWACGYATMLTQTTHGENKPPSTRRPEVAYPSSVTVIRRMLSAAPGRVGWIACTACSAERGSTNHIPEVRLRSPGRYMATVQASANTLFIGGA